MRAVRYTRPGIGRIATTEDPVAGEGQLVLAVGSSGICGTDVHIIRGEYPSSSLPRIIGHEFAGTVVQLVTHRFPLDQFDQALAAMGSPEAIKVHIQPGR